MYEHLQKWGSRKQEVKFFLRHEDSPTESSDQGCQTVQIFSLLPGVVLHSAVMKCHSWNNLGERKSDIY